MSPKKIKLAVLWKLHSRLSSFDDVNRLAELSELLLHHAKFEKIVEMTAALYGKKDTRAGWHVAVSECDCLPIVEW